MEARTAEPDAESTAESSGATPESGGGGKGGGSDDSLAEGSTSDTDDEDEKEKGKEYSLNRDSVGSSQATVSPPHSHLSRCIESC